MKLKIKQKPEAGVDTIEVEVEDTPVVYKGIAFYWTYDSADYFDPIKLTEPLSGYAIVGGTSKPICKKRLKELFARISIAQFMERVITSCDGKILNPQPKPNFKTKSAQ